MTQHQYELTFDRYKKNISLRELDEDLKPRHGWQHRSFPSCPDAAWSKMAKILIDETRKLKSGEELSFLLLGRRLGEKGQGLVSCVDQDQMLGINVLLDEIVRLQEGLRKQRPAKIRSQGRKRRG